MQKERTEKGRSYRILAGSRFQDNATWQTGLNNNDLIIGSSGSGKTRGYVLPNIRNTEESFLVADTKGNLLKQTKEELEKKGYQIVNIDFTDCMDSPYGYNPLANIHYDSRRRRYNEQDILKISSCIIPTVKSVPDPYWDNAARMYLQCLIAYVMECCPKAEQTMTSVIDLFEEKSANNLVFKELMRELEHIDPDSFSVHRYRMIKGNETAEKMNASIQGVLAEKLSVLSFGGAEKLLGKERQFKITEMGEKKTAVFLNVSDTDRSLDPLVNLFYTQVFQELCRHADSRSDSRLKVPVRLILDDFASNTVIPEFDGIISNIRSREISVSIIIQSLSQLDSLYGKDRARTILNNCDHCLYLGGQDVETAKFYSVKANKNIHTLLNMPPDKMWLFTRGQEAELLEKYI